MTGFENQKMNAQAQQRELISEAVRDISARGLVVHVRDTEKGQLYTWRQRVGGATTSAFVLPPPGFQTAYAYTTGSVGLSDNFDSLKVHPLAPSLI